jgi:hypothetical protein
MKNQTIQMIPGINLTRGGIEISTDLTFDEWRSLLVGLRRIKTTYHAALADVIGFGKNKFGEASVDSALEQEEFEFADVSRAKQISAVPFCLRDEFCELTSEHYYVASKKFPNDTVQQRHWLKTATEQGLSSVELKASMDAGKVIKSNISEKQSGRQSGGLMTIENISINFQRWEKQVGGEDEILKWDEQRKLEFMKKTAEIDRIRKKIMESMAS